MIAALKLLTTAETSGFGVDLNAAPRAPRPGTPGRGVGVRGLPWQGFAPLTPSPRPRVRGRGEGMVSQRRSASRIRSKSSLDSNASTIWPRSLALSLMSTLTLNF
jgi:hypothetical protein